MSYRILQVIDKLSTGGAERVLVDLSNLIFKAGIYVEVLTLVSPGELHQFLSPDIPFRCIGRKKKFSLKSMYKVHVHCKSFDIIHVHLRYNFRYISLVKILFFGKYKILHHDHFGDIEKETSIPFGLAFFSKLNPFYIGVSRHLIDWARVKLNLPPQNTWLLPNIIVRSSSPKQQVKRNNPVEILVVSNFRHSKNLVFLIQLLSELKTHLPIRVTIVGKVADQQYYQSIIDLISANELSSLVAIDTSRDEIQGIIHQFDLAIHTADQESGPLVLIEYLAHHLPFVAYKTGEVSDQLKDFFPQFFVEDFVVANWINRIVENLKENKNLESEMENVFNKYFSGEKYLSSVCTIYKSIHSVDERQG